MATDTGVRHGIMPEYSAGTIIHIQAAISRIRPRKSAILDVNSFDRSE
jgi:hypothetical protein